MSVKRYVVTFDPGARNSLVEIQSYIAEKAPETAPTFAAQLLDECYRLEILPYRHQRRRRSRRVPFPLWQMPFKSYRIIYTIFEEAGEVRILGLQHGSRRRWP